MREVKKFAFLALMAVPVSGFGSGYCEQDSSDGIIIEADKSRVISVYRQPVKFLDRSGVRKASVIAQERAKGAIVRYFSQFQTTMREIEEVDQDGEDATRIVDSNGDVTARTITRNQSAVLRQLDASFAASNISGILQIEESFDKEMSEVCVAVGYSAKSNEMVKKSKEWMKGNTVSESNEASVHSGGASMKPGKQSVDSYSRIRKDDW